MAVDVAEVVLTAAFLAETDAVTVSSSSVVLVDEVSLDSLVESLDPDVVSAVDVSLDSLAEEVDSVVFAVEESLVVLTVEVDSDVVSDAVSLVVLVAISDVCTTAVFSAAEAVLSAA